MFITKKEGLVEVQIPKILGRNGFCPVRRILYNDIIGRMKNKRFGDIYYSQIVIS